MDFKVVEGVQCMTCNKLHDIESKTFISFHGNVTIGKGGGIYGNSDNTLISVFCKNSKCLESLLSAIDNKSIILTEKAEITTNHTVSDEVNIETTEVQENREDFLNTKQTEENPKDITKSDTKDAMSAFDPKKFE